MHKYDVKHIPTCVNHKYRIKSREYTPTEAGCALNEAASVCHATPRCDLFQNEKCESVQARRNMLTANTTCAVLASAGTHVDGPTAGGSGHAAHNRN